MLISRRNLPRAIWVGMGRRGEASRTAWQYACDATLAPSTVPWPTLDCVLYGWMHASNMVLISFHLATSGLKKVCISSHLIKVEQR